MSRKPRYLSSSSVAVCSNCGEEIYSWQVIKGEYQLAPYRVGPKTTTVVCGKCIGHGLLTKKKLDEVWGELITDLKKPIVNLRSYRKQLKMNQEQLAEILKVDRSMVAKVERGRKPMPESWREILRGHIFEKHGLHTLSEKNVT